jgi:DNA-binding cell septation regulator SpoVG
MAKNCAKITELGPIVGLGKRKVETVSVDACVGAGQAFETYGIKEGDVLVFPALEDALIEKVQVTEGNDKAFVYYLACKKTNNGETRDTRFNVNILHRRDVNNKPLHEYWYNLGDISARIKKLCEVGSIKCTGLQKFNDTIWVDNKPQMVTDENGATVRAFEVKEAPIIEVA